MEKFSDSSYESCFTCRYGEIDLVFRLVLLFLIFNLIVVDHSNGVTLDKVSKKSNWNFDLKKFHSKLFLKLDIQPQELRMPLSKMRRRIQKSTVDHRVEPLYVPLKENRMTMKKIAKQLAKAGNTATLLRYFEDNIAGAPTTGPGSSSKKVPLNHEAFNLLDKKSFGDRFASTHYDIKVDSKNLQKNKITQKEFLSQIGEYFSSEEKRKIQNKIKHGIPLDVNKDLLPKFAKKMVKKFTIYKGPNCFHAAMAFQNKKFTNSSKFNVKKEQGYHRAMINYDELYRTLQAEFYEIDPNKDPIKYGDVIVFMDIPSKRPEHMNFKWIRHTATYLFNGFTFSKGSKSPNTPYSIKKLTEEWNTWDRFTKLLSVKVFRKSGKSVRKVPTSQLNSWIY